MPTPDLALDEPRQPDALPGVFGAPSAVALGARREPLRARPLSRRSTPRRPTTSRATASASCTSHVPAAMLAMGCYALMALAALGTLVWRHPLADVAAKSAAPLGAAFTLPRPRHRLDLGQADVGRVVGVGRAADLVPRALHHVSRADRALARLRRSGARRPRRRRPDPRRLVNIPIIKFSVDWWNTLHQGESIFRMDGPSIDPSML